jgi:hypothetical protein
MPKIDYIFQFYFCASVEKFLHLNNTGNFQTLVAQKKKKKKKKKKKNNNKVINK